MPTITNQPARAPRIHHADPDAVRETKRRLGDLQRIRDTWVAHIIAKGVLTQGDTEVIALIAETVFDAKPLEDQFRALRERLDRAGVDQSMNITPDYRTNDIGAAALAYATEFGEAGYVLGLAVGMQLGPHAFGAGTKGGAR